MAIKCFQFLAIRLAFSESSQFWVCFFLLWFYPATNNAQIILVSQEMDVLDVKFRTYLPQKIKAVNLSQISQKMYNIDSLYIPTIAPQSEGPGCFYFVDGEFQIFSESHPSPFPIEGYSSLLNFSKKDLVVINPLESREFTVFVPHPYGEKDICDVFVNLSMILKIPNANSSIFCIIKINCGS